MTCPRREKLYLVHVVKEREERKRENRIKGTHPQIALRALKSFQREQYV
jgi:hypothetical protein